MNKQVIIRSVMLCIVISLGCFNPFAPKLSDDMEQGELIITEQSTPDEVLKNFQVAYVIRDSLLYANCIDTGFVFRYYDPEASSSGHEISWYREKDLLTTSRLFRHFNMIDLIWNATLYAWTKDDEGQICRGFQLQLSNSSSDYFIRGRAVFTFRRGTDEKWRISQWKDESEI